MYPELDLLAEYGSVRRHRLEIPRTLSATSYVGWLKTDSLVLSLSPEHRRGFLADISHLIESKYNGEASRNRVYSDLVCAGDRRTKVWRVTRVENQGRMVVTVGLDVGRRNRIQRRSQ